MKNFLLIIFSFSAFFLSCNLKAQTSNNLVIFSQAGEKFYLIINGVRQNMDPETNVKVMNLDQPSYKIKVIFENKSLPNVDRTLGFPEFGNEYVFQISSKKGKYKLAYVSQAPIKKDGGSVQDQKVVYFNQRPDTVVTTITTTTTTTTTDVNPNSNANANTTVNTNTNSNTTNTNTNTTGLSININENGMSVNGVGVDVNVNTTGMGVNTQVKETNISTNTNTTVNTTNTTSSGAAVSADNSSRYIDNGIMCHYPTLSKDQFVKIKYEIDQRTLVTKMGLTKDYVKKNCMEAAQVAELVKLFDYASDQLELAKFCYQYTFDTKNYDLVLNAMKHDDNKAKLLEVIGTGSSSSNSSAVNTTTTNTNANLNTNVNNATTTTTTTVVEKQVVSSSNTNAAGASNGRCTSPVSDEEFQTAKKSIQSKSFEDSRFTLAKQILKNKCLSAKQVKEIMLLFSFEQTRLDFAKFAYDYTADKDNYYILNDAFTFESSISELNQYLESK